MSQPGWSHRRGMGVLVVDPNCGSGTMWSCGIQTFDRGRPTDAVSKQDQSDSVVASRFAGRRTYWARPGFSTALQSTTQFGITAQHPGNGGGSDEPDIGPSLGRRRQIPGR